MAQRILDGLLAAGGDGGGGLKWSHCRLMVTGPGNAGKTSVIRALSGQPFDRSSESTVGAATSTMQLERREVLLQGGAGKALQPYVSDSSELATAIAAQAAAQMQTLQTTAAADADANVGADGTKVASGGERKGKGEGEGEGEGEGVGEGEGEG